MLGKRRCCCEQPGSIVQTRGCSNKPLPGTSIDIYNTVGGTLLATVTTDSLGRFTYPNGTYYCIEQSGRFAGANLTIIGGSNLTFTPATGYVCDRPGLNAQCAWPVSKTLQYTDSILGSTTLTWANVGGNHVWSGVIGYSYGGASCRSCATGNVNVNVDVTSFFPDPVLRWDTQLVPNTCPFISGTLHATVTYNPTTTPISHACYVPGVSAPGWSASFTTASNCLSFTPGGYASTLYGGPSTAVTLTLTE